MEVPCVFSKQGRDQPGVPDGRKACLKKQGEMAIDRMYADNNKISVGDNTEKWFTKVESHRICGIV